MKWKQGTWVGNRKRNLGRTSYVKCQSLVTTADVKEQAFSFTNLVAKKHQNNVPFLDAWHQGKLRLRNQG